MDKIIIKKSPNADSRTASGNVTKEMLIEQSLSHIHDVKCGLDYFASLLKLRGVLHDFTKISYIDEFYNDFKQFKQFKGQGFTSATWYPIHITEERHHIKDNPRSDVNMFDILEHVVDCVMAGKARSGEAYIDEMPSEVLQLAYKNTMQLLIDKVEVEEAEIDI